MNIINFIEHLQCPLVDGIIFPNEIVKLFDITVDWSIPLKYMVTNESITTFTELKNENKFFIANCAILSTVIDVTKQIKVISGEGNYGSDGFISIIDLKSDELIWMVYFKCSNPFVNIAIENSHIVARSSLNCNWVFELDNPSKININCI